MPFALVMKFKMQTKKVFNLKFMTKGNFIVMLVGHKILNIRGAWTQTPLLVFIVTLLNAVNFRFQDVSSSDGDKYSYNPCFPFTEGQCDQAAVSIGQELNTILTRLWGYQTLMLNCSTHLSMTFIIPINVKMPTVVGTLTFICMINTGIWELEIKESPHFSACILVFMSSWNYMLSWIEQSFITSEHGIRTERERKRESRKRERERKGERGRQRERERGRRGGGLRERYWPRWVQSLLLTISPQTAKRRSAYTFAQSD